MLGIIFALLVGADEAKDAKKNCAPYDACEYLVSGTCVQDHSGTGPCHATGIGKNPCGDWKDSKGKAYHMTCVADSDAALACGAKTSGECTITHQGCCSPTEVVK